MKVPLLHQCLIIYPIISKIAFLVLGLLFIQFHSIAVEHRKSTSESCDYMAQYKFVCDFSVTYFLKFNLNVVSVLNL